MLESMAHSFKFVLSYLGPLRSVIVYIWVLMVSVGRPRHNINLFRNPMPVNLMLTHISFRAIFRFGMTTYLTLFAAAF